ncbi:cell division ABC-type permease like protein FtsX [Psychroflexus torquis ATCC 700755]|uniref:Cell division protein FtsX n=1 Tax=Psychroflexus torquis (strain ATCC 700755 / CIP 106069 / ACAM 623) TaxID=313595 RepID=K4IF61_PSYTT|nr:permease-like cell division protein FtsX [Psychroflexus torquis]AFU69009.1 cell division ABC-type permease like protein FtsX [Psychroflexus torquis ATCC 700755]
MASSFEKYQKRRLITSYFSVVISIALVLFLVGLLALLVLNTKKVADNLKEQIALTVYLKDTAKEVEIDQMQKSLALAEYSKTIVFVSKEEAAKAYSEEIGEDFMEFLGYNPLQNSIDVYFNADYVSETQIAEISRDLGDKEFVDEIVYDKPLIALLNDNIKRLSFWILIVSGLLTFIAVLLINSSIRLSVYAKRFTIKTMQMVGATKHFIRRPFILKSIKLGLIGSTISLIGMGVVLYYLNKSFPELNLISDEILLAAIFVGVLIMGILISWLSTFFATQRFLNLKTDELYY